MLHFKNNAHARAQLEADKVGDVVVDAFALLDGRLDGDKVVVDEDHISRFLAHVGAGKAHRDSNVRFLQRHRVVYTITGHRYHFTNVLQRLEKTYSSSTFLHNFIVLIFLSSKKIAALVISKTGPIAWHQENSTTLTIFNLCFGETR